jgi:hypothetical protein
MKTLISGIVDSYLLKGQSDTSSQLKNMSQEQNVAIRASLKLSVSENCASEPSRKDGWVDD